MDERQFLSKRRLKKQAIESSYLSRCEETTIYAKDQGEYLCECPRREALPEGEQATKEHETKMQVLALLVEKSKTWQQGGKTEEEIKELVKEEIIEVFKGTAFNVCENQQLQLLKGTEMGVK